MAGGPYSERELIITNADLPAEGVRSHLPCHCRRYHRAAKPCRACHGPLSVYLKLVRKNQPSDSLQRNTSLAEEGDLPVPFLPADAGLHMCIRRLALHTCRSRHARTSRCRRPQPRRRLRTRGPPGRRSRGCCAHRWCALRRRRIRPSRRRRTFPAASPMVPFIPRESLSLGANLHSGYLKLTSHLQTLLTRLSLC